MALQIRRGVDGSGTGGRLTITPAAGELLYTTDTKRLYIGDGTTVGGNIMTGSGIGNLVEDTTPQLGGNLDVNGSSIVSVSNGDINIDPNGTGNVVLHGNLNIDSLGNITKTGQLNISPTTVLSVGNNTSLVDGNLYLTRNSYSAVSGQGFTFAQHHATVDAVNFTFYRSRGTGTTPLVVVNGDDLADISFLGYDGTNRASGAAISATVEGVPTLGHIPTKISFSTDNGVAIAVRAELSAAGVWKVNNLQNFSGTDLTLTATTVKVAGDLQLNNRGDLKFADADSSNYVAFQAPATVAANVTWTLPATDGTSGQLLSTDGTGTLGWATVSGGGGALSSRTVVNATTASLNNGATGNISITGAKGYVLYKIETTAAAWIRIYTDTASQSADSSRLEGTDPLPGSGVIAEIITTGAGTILMSPGVIGFNTEAVVSNVIACAVTNKSGASAAITVSLTILTIEV